MRKVIFLFFFIICLAGCEQPVPNPIIGSYTMPDYSNPVLDNGALALKADGTFIYVELISSSSQYQVRIDGTYEISLGSYNFISADGSVTFTVPDGGIPDAISGLMMKEGKNTFLFDWTCDRNTGPVSLTLVADTDDSSKNFEFEYLGSAGKLDALESILPDELMPGVDGEPESPEEGTEEPPAEDDGTTQTPETDDETPADNGVNE